MPPRTPTGLSRVVVLTLAGLLAVGVGSGCREQAAEAQPPPPPTVTVVAARAMDVPIEVETTGTTRARQEVTIRARVTGFLEERSFEEGSYVEAGQLLFVIDEEPFQARVDMAKGQRDEAAAALKAARESKQPAVAAAQLAVAQAQLFFAQIQETRDARLLQRNSLSREEYDEARAALQQAQADVQARQAALEQSQVTFQSDIALAEARLQQAEADLTQAKLDLSYCRMYSPIDGRIGAALIKPGNYVGMTGQVQADQGAAPALATVQLLDPIEVEIRPSARYLPEATALAQRGLDVRLIVEGEREYPHEGRVFFIDNVVDTTTSTFLVRALVPNPEHTLLPGMYVQVLMTIGRYRGVVTVPEEAVIATQAGPTLYVLDEENRVTVTPVEALEPYQGLRVIASGLEAGQRVITEGLQLVRPGMIVQFEETDYGFRERPREQPRSTSLRREAVIEGLLAPKPTDAPPEADSTTDESPPPDPNAGTVADPNASTVADPNADAAAAPEGDEAGEGAGEDDAPATLPTETGAPAPLTSQPDSSEPVPPAAAGAAGPPGP